MELRDYQSEAVLYTYDFLQAKDGHPLIVIPTGGGKCLGRDTPVMMFDGTVKMVQDVQVGDRLMGPDSLPRNVLAIGNGRETLYRVTPTKGDSYVVNESHILSLKLTPDAPGERHQVVNLGVRDYLAATDTFRHRAKGWRVGVDFPTKSVPVDPYFLGLWLADGDAEGLKISKPDPEVKASLTEYANSLGLSVHTYTSANGGCPTHAITAGRYGPRSGRNTLLTAMRLLGVIGNKHVPHLYLANDRETRLKLLAGLIDGDGHLHHSGYEFSSVNERIADAVVYLARSIGLASYKVLRTTSDQNGTPCESFRVSVSGNCHLIPCRIERKKCPPRKQNKDVLVTGIKVEAIGEGDYYGFEIDGDHLFLLGDFTVTHNTPVIAQLCSDAVTLWGGRVLVLAHVKELLEQTAGALRRLCPAVPVGVYSAGLGRREVSRPVTVAGIQSVYDKAEIIGRVDLVIVDEAHLIPPEGEGRYGTILEDLTEINPNLRVIGLTATPYRLSGGLIYKTRDNPDRLFEAVCYEVGVKHLVQRGFLSPLVGKAALCEIDTDSLKVVRGEYDDGQAEEAFSDVVSGAVDEVVSKTVDRRAVLLFCQTVQHGRMVAARLRAEIVGREKDAADETLPARDTFGLGDDPLAFHALPVVWDWLQENGHPVAALTEWLRRGKAAVGEVYGDTPDDERAELIRQFRDGHLRYLVNVNVLTTGFDAPNVDCVCLLRATVSAGLYYQMVGRGFRLSPGKSNCLVLDFGQNIKRHGPVDRVNGEGKKKNQGGEAVAKMCPECRTVVAGGVSVCPDCGHVWPVREFEAKHAGRADADTPLSTGKTAVDEYEVLGVTYRPHTKKDAAPGHPKTLRVDYRTGVGQSVSEWVCVEHEEGSFAHTKAQQWWRKRCRFPMPATAAEAAVVAIHGLLATPTTVTTKTKPGEKYPSVNGVEVGERPTHPTPCRECGAVNKGVVMPHHERWYPGRIVCAMCDTHVTEVGAEVVERYGFYDPVNPPGLLPLEWEFEEVFDPQCQKCGDMKMDSYDDATNKRHFYCPTCNAPQPTLFDQINNLAPDVMSGATEIDEVPW